MPKTRSPTRSTRTKRIAIFGGNIGNKNLGDEATIAAVIHNIRRRDPNIDLRAFVVYCGDTSERHGILAFPQRRGYDPFPPDANRQQEHQAGTDGRRAGLLNGARAGLRRLPWVFGPLRAVKKYIDFVPGLLLEPAFIVQSVTRLAGADLLLFAGSGQLFDGTPEGPWQFPYSCFKWVLLARFVRAKVAFISVGAGPISSRLSKMFFRTSLSMGVFRSFRDDTSKRLIEDLGVRGENHLFPDLVFSLPVATLPPAGGKNRRRTVGLNVLPYFDIRFSNEHNAAVYTNYVRSIAEFAVWLFQSDYDVILFPTQLRMDPSAIQDVKQIMEREGGGPYMHRVRECNIQTVEDLVEQISAIDVVVATRFHGVLISYLLNKSVLGICHQQKTKDLMQDMGQANFMIDIYDCDSNSLIRLFSELESSAEAVKPEIERRVRERRQALEEQYDLVVGLLGPSTGAAPFADK
jgi:polysaccharide pyruvyl transferase WcaK-like protein